MQPRKVCVVLVDRANYGRLKPVMQAISDHPEMDMQVIATGTYNNCTQTLPIPDGTFLQPVILSDPYLLL